MEDSETVYTCNDGFMKNDALWVSLALIVSITPLFVGLIGCYMIKSTIFVPVRMFCYSFTAYSGLVINVWVFPYLGCPGVPMTQYPALIKVAIQLGYFIIPAGLTLSGCEFAWYCTKNRIFASIKLSDDVGYNWDQSDGFKTVWSYFSNDEKECPLKIEVQHQGRCFGNAHDEASDSKDDEDLGELPLYIDSDDFKYDRIEDHSDKLPDFPTLKSWQAVQIKFSKEVLPGDQLTLNQMMIWEEEHKKRFRKYTEDNFEELKKKNGDMPFNHVQFDKTMKLDNLPGFVLIHEPTTKPWYLTPICWVIAFCGVWCILWLPVSLGVWRVKKFNIVVRKYLFINKEKYERSE